MPGPTPTRTTLLTVAFAASLLVATSCAGLGRSDLPTLSPGTEVDLERFMGTWHVIAHIPYWAERGKVTPRDIYTLREDGRIDNVYAFRNRFDQPERRWNGISEVVPGSGGAHWRVRFLWPFKVDLLVLEVAEDYSWALLGHPQRRYAWIFSRESRMDQAQYADLQARFAAYGYAPDDLVRIPHHPDQLGQPGFR